MESRTKKINPSGQNKKISQIRKKYQMNVRAYKSWTVVYMTTVKHSNLNNERTSPVTGFNSKAEIVKIKIHKDVVIVQL